MNEQMFETELIQYITTGTVTNPECLAGIPEFSATGLGNKVVKTKLWKYDQISKQPLNFGIISRQYWSNIIKMC